jgi:hypothetical protein
MNFWQNIHVKLRAVEPSDAEFFFDWNQDSEWKATWTRRGAGQA